MTPPNKRPLGVSILAYLYIFSGLLFLWLLISGLGNLGKGMGALGLSASLAYFSLFFLGGLSLAAGAGMCTGKKWGWWLGAFYLFFSVARNLNALMQVSSLIEQFGMPASGATKYYIKHTGRIVVHSLVIGYFFKQNVVDYFGVGTISSWKRFWILFSALIVVGLVFAALTLIAK